MVLSHKTSTGRIVYDRPKHKFTLGDATRILARINPDEFGPNEMAAFAEQLAIVTAKFWLRYLWQTLNPADMVFRLLEFYWAVIVAVRGDVEALGLNLLAALRDWVLGHTGDAVAPVKKEEEDGG